MSVKGGQLRLGLFAMVLALLCGNALALWGDQTAGAEPDRTVTLYRSVIRLCDALGLT